jgi:NTE family protein
MPPNPLALVVETEGRTPPIDLIVLERDDVGRVASAPSSTEQFAAVFHLRARHQGDIERIARHLTDRSIGLVLSGGAARGFAHIGAIRALREAGVPFDRVGGTSMGGIIGACVAAEWDDREIRTRMHQSFVETNPLNDYTLPWVSLFRGRSVERLLQRHFGDIRIEALWRPFFCASSNLTSGTLTVHRGGPLWRALRASIALPGVLPPVLERGEVLVDGGVINTFPVDVMAEAAAGPIIGVNVATELVLTPGEAAHGHSSRFRFHLRPDPEMPSMLSILMHATTISSSLQVAVCRSQTTLLLEPPLSHVPLLDWRAFDRAVEAGYRHTVTTLERADLGALKLLP